MREATKHELGNMIYKEYLLFDVQPNIDDTEFVLYGGLISQQFSGRKDANMKK